MQTNLQEVKKKLVITQVVSMVTTPTTSHTIDGKPPLATVAMTETGHFLFVLRGGVSSGGVVPGQLGAGLHDPDGKKKMTIN